jgi:hypothetical protein
LTFVVPASRARMVFIGYRLIRRNSGAVLKRRQPKPNRRWTQINADSRRVSSRPVTLSCPPGVPHPPDYGRNFPEEDTLGIQFCLCLHLSASICVHLRLSLFCVQRSLLFQTKCRIIFYVVRIYQDAVNRLFFVFAGFAGIEVLIGLFHSQFRKMNHRL